MTEIERIFKTNDLNTTDQLYQNKKDSIQDLEKNSDGSDNSKQEISNLTKQIEELKEQVRELKQSLKSILEGAKDYAQKLFNWFKTKKVKQLTWRDDEQVLVEYNDGKSETLSGDYVKKDEVLSQFEEHCQQSEQKSISFSELNQITGSSSPNTSPKHWEKYGKYYIGAGIVLVLIALGAAVYHFLTKEK